MNIFYVFELLKHNINAKTTDILIKVNAGSDLAISDDGKKLFITLLSSNPDSSIYEDIIIFDFETKKKEKVLTKYGNHPRGIPLWTRDNLTIIHEIRNFNEKLNYELLDVMKKESNKLNFDTSNFQGDVFIWDLNHSMIEYS